MCKTISERSNGNGYSFSHSRNTIAIKREGSWLEIEMNYFLENV